MLTLMILSFIIIGSIFLYFVIKKNIYIFAGFMIIFYGIAFMFFCIDIYMTQTVISGNEATEKILMIEEENKKLESKMTDIIIESVVSDKINFDRDILKDVISTLNLNDEYKNYIINYSEIIRLKKIEIEGKNARWFVYFGR